MSYRNPQYQLEIRQADKWIPVCKEAVIKILHNYLKVSVDKTTITGWRIFKADRKRLKSGELAGGPKAAARRPAPGARHVRDLAKDAAEHIIKTKQKTIHVYPLGKTYGNASNQFRKHLFGQLTGRVGDGRDRVKSEEIAVNEFGYIIIEVDPEEWMFTPDLEEAA